MNIFELTAIVTPISGAIAAGRVAAASGFLMCTVFAMCGMLLGVGIYFFAIGLSAAVAHILQLDRRPDGVLAGLGGLLAILFVVASPIASVFVAAILAPLFL